APLIFKDVTEYFLVLVLAALLLPPLDDESAKEADDEGFISGDSGWKVFRGIVGLPFRLMRRLDRGTGGLLSFTLNLGLPLLLCWASYQLLGYFDSPAGKEVADKVHDWMQARAEAWNINPDSLKLSQ